MVVADGGQQCAVCSEAESSINKEVKRNIFLEIVLISDYV